MTTNVNTVMTFEEFRRQMIAKGITDENTILEEYRKYEAKNSKTGVTKPQFQDTSETKDTTNLTQ